MSQCGYRKLQMDRSRSRWPIAVTRACTEWADKGMERFSGQLTTIDGLNEKNNWNVDSNGTKVSVTSPADWAMPHDPGHEFEDVKEQLCGLNGNYPAINNSGFVTNYSETHHFDNPAEIMKCYAPDQLPVLTTLAKEFAVCDHWYSSMPGPTWPNRFFVHAASTMSREVKGS